MCIDYFVSGSKCSHDFLSAILCVFSFLKVAPAGTLSLVGNNVCVECFVCGSGSLHYFLAAILCVLSFLKVAPDVHIFEVDKCNYLVFSNWLRLSTLPIVRSSVCVEYFCKWLRMSTFLR